MKLYRGDLHVHTVLSPCADRAMLPARIVARAFERGLTLLAICDHNSAGNVEAVQDAAATAGNETTVLAGIEITTTEEVHLLGLFDATEAAEAVSARVRATLPPLANPPSWMGPQQLVDGADAVRGEEDRMLATASGLSLEQAVALIHEHGGLAIAAHIDRPSFSVIAQLGFVPPDAGLDALEISVAGVQRGALERFAREGSQGLPLISSSDSHCLEEIGAGQTTFEMAAPNLKELSLALAGHEGRRCHVA